MNSTSFAGAVQCLDTVEILLRVKSSTTPKTSGSNGPRSRSCRHVMMMPHSQISPRSAQQNAEFSLGPANRASMVWHDIQNACYERARP